MIEVSGSARSARTSRSVQQPDLRIEHLDVPARRLVREHADAACAASGHGASMTARACSLDDRLGLALETIDIARRDHAFGFETRRVQRDRIAGGPVGIQLAIRVALLGERRVLPRWLRIAAEIQHVVVVRVAAHAHRHGLDERRPEARARALGRPGEGRGDLIGIGAVDRDARHAVAGRLVGEHPHGRLLRERRRQRGLVVLDAEDRRQPPRRAQVDRLVPLAERRSAFADERDRNAARPVAPERHRHAGNRQRRRRQRRGRRQNAPAEVADVQILAFERRADLAHLRVEHHPHGVGLGPHRERDRRDRESPGRRRRPVQRPSACRYSAPRRSRMPAA